MPSPGGWSYIWRITFSQCRYYGVEYALDGQYNSGRNHCVNLLNILAVLCGIRRTDCVWWVMSLLCLSWLLMAHHHKRRPQQEVSISFYRCVGVRRLFLLLLLNRRVMPILSVIRGSTRHCDLRLLSTAIVSTRVIGSDIKTTFIGHWFGIIIFLVGESSDRKGRGAAI